jgi:hypothetical protein
MKDSKGWDGKLRVDRHAVITNPEALEDPNYSDEDAPPVEEIEADEGTNWRGPGRLMPRGDGEICCILWGVTGLCMRKWADVLLVVCFRSVGRLRR